MNIRWKLSFFFLLMSLVPLIAFSVLSITRAQKILKEEIGKGYELVAQEKATQVAFVLDRRLDEASSFAKNLTLRQDLIEANKSYVGKSPADNQKQIKAIDQAWIKAKGDIPEAKDILTNDLSVLLRKYRDRNHLEYGEIFITDKFGATVAMTSTLTDYYQADEGWWQEGYAKGQGAIYIDDRGYDLSAKTVVTGVVVPIRVNDKVLGLLKINFKMAHIPSIISSPYERPDVNIFMFRTNGTAVINAVNVDRSQANPTEGKVLSQGRSRGWVEDEHDKQPTIMGYALVHPKKQIFSRFMSEDSKKGVAGETWGPSQWYVYVERTRRLAYAPLNKLIAVLLVGTGVVAMLTVFVAGATAGKITEPLLALRKGMKNISEGDLDYKIESNQTDEIGAVIQGINSMGEQLKKTLASRDELNEEIVFRKEVEKALKDKTKELEQATWAAVKANQSKSEFLTSMSHELRTPLNAVLGFAQILQLDTKTPLNDKQRDATNQIIKGGEHLLDLINDILNLSKIETGHIELDIEPVESLDVIKECMSMVKTLADDMDLTIDVPNTGSAIVEADHVRLKQVLFNLMSNAVKYNRPKGTVTVTSTILDNKKALRISVADTGKGIATGKQDELFVPFSRLGAENSNIEGTGIGLSITQKLLNAMGGQIGFESKEGIGSVFWAELPLSESKETEHQTADVAANINEEDMSGHVLYIEDNIANSILMETILSNVPGLKLKIAPSAELGLAMAHQNKPDLILMDINLPGMSGNEALVELKKHKKTKDIPVIAITADAMAKDIRKGLDDGFIAYLTKPFNVTELINSVQEIMTKS